jgi:hypothetical protein
LAEDIHEASSAALLATTSAHLLLQLAQHVVHPAALRPGLARLTALPATELPEQIAETTQSTLPALLRTTGCAAELAEQITKTADATVLPAALRATEFSKQIAETTKPALLLRLRLRRAFHHHLDQTACIEHGGTLRLTLRHPPLGAP